MKFRAKVTAWAAAIGLAFGFGFIAANPAIKADEAVAKDKSDMTTLVKGNNQFAFELYGKLRESEKGNIFYSPYSISTALAMTYEGARGNTASEMAKTLHLDIDQNVAGVFGQLQKRITGEGKERPFKLDTANGIWVKKGYPLVPEFKTTVEDRFGGKFQAADFAGESEKVAKEINDWVESKTNNKIKDLIAASSLTEDTRLILVNAIYFKSDWLNQFKKDATKDEDFHVSADGKVKAPLMHDQRELNYVKTASYSAVALPYVGNEVSMIVVLPNQVDGLATVEKEIISSGLDETIRGLKEHDVDLSFPRFKSTSGFQLAETLQGMGMKKAFEGNADFAGISPAAPGEGLCIARVIHKAFVEVDEKGTEAAAATGVDMVRPTSIRQPPPKAVFKADHPFLFAIRHNATNSVLFLGRVVDPTK